VSRNLPLPYFPIPPQEYQSPYFQEILRSISMYMDNIQNAGEGRATFMVLTNLQTDDVGLETGTLFQQGGFVKITLSNSSHVRGSTGTGGVGTVTVIT